MRITWKRLATSLGGVIAGAVLGAIMGFLEAYAAMWVLSHEPCLDSEEGLRTLAAI